MSRFLIGQTLALLALFLGIRMEGGRAILWLHPAPMTLCFVLLAPLLALLSARPFGDLRQALRDAAEPGPSPTRAASRELWKLLETCVYFGTALGFLSGLMISLQFLDQEPRLLGAKFAATLVSPFLGALLALACRVLRARVEQGLPGD